MSTLLPSFSARPFVTSGTAVTPPVPVLVAAPVPSRRSQVDDGRGSDLNRDGIAGGLLAVVCRQREHVRPGQREGGRARQRERVAERDRSRAARLAPGRGDWRPTASVVSYRSDQERGG